MTHLDLTHLALTQFAPDAVVEDEGREHHGLDAIGDWLDAVPSVHHDVRGIERPSPGVEDSVVEVSGDFPGSPVTLRFHVERDVDGLISVLRIRV